MSLHHLHENNGKKRLCGAPACCPSADKTIPHPFIQKVTGWHWDKAKTFKVFEFEPLEVVHD
jgi:hypothetical protein